MSTKRVDLLELQSKIKRDAEGYFEDFDLQYRHYKACVEIFQLKPSKDSAEFAELVTFVSQVCGCYPKTTAGYADELIGLLDKHHMVLDSHLRRIMAQALILLRNRGQLAATKILPLFFRLFRCPDRTLRQLLYRHIVTDLKQANQKHKNEQLNRSVQNFLYGMLQDENETAAKKSLGVIIEMHRKQIWTDARAVNVIASAVFHKSVRMMSAALKFFLGQDERDGGEDSDDEGDPSSAPPARVAGETTATSAPKAADVYSATKKGTDSTKKKKQKKLKRVMAAVKRQEKKAVDGGRSESFAALELLHDPQGFAEKLLQRLQKGDCKFEIRLLMVMVLSRTIGCHRLLLLNYYPFLQKYMQPHQREATHILAAMVQATHELVPPEVLQPVVRQLVNQFVSDHCRAEAMAVGLKTVREICVRAPLVMTEDLLRDLVAYKKSREKGVAMAARSLMQLFRELAPSLLEKKDRGRGADLDAQVKVYGKATIADRVAGADLLEEEIRTGGGGDEFFEDLYANSDSDDDSDSEVGMEEGGSGEDEEGGGSEAEEGEEGEEGSEEEAEVEADEEDEEEEVVEEEPAGKKGKKARAEARKAKRELRKSGGGEDSLADLKRQLAEAQAKKLKRKRAEEGKEEEEAAGGGEGEGGQGGEKGEEGEEGPIEQTRFLGPEDFARIAYLKKKKLLSDTMQKYGLKKLTKKRQAMVEEAAAEAGKLQESNERTASRRIDPDSLMSGIHHKMNKTERLDHVMAGREDRDFGAKSARKKNKTGGQTNKEKDAKKTLPMAARMQAARHRISDRRKVSKRAQRKAFGQKKK